MCCGVLLKSADDASALGSRVLRVDGSGPSTERRRQVRLTIFLELPSALLDFVLKLGLFQSGKCF